jgi:hypothetical protein
MSGISGMSRRALELFLRTVQESGITRMSRIAPRTLPPRIKDIWNVLSMSSRIAPRTLPQVSSRIRNIWNV